MDIETSTTPVVPETKAEKKSDPVALQRAADALLLWLARHPLDQIPRATTGDIYVWKVGNVMVVRHDESVPSVFLKLIAENFLGAPVMMNGRYYGWVDMLDLVKYTSDLFSGETHEAWTDFFEKKDDWRNATVEDVMKTPLWGTRRPAVDPFHPALDTSSLLHVWELMARQATHRVALLNQTDDLTGILTESMCISMLRQNMARLGPLATISVREFKEHLRAAICIKETDKALDAFDLMLTKNVSGVAIVDAAGTLTGAISVRDLRGVGGSGEQFARLYRSVKEFKEQALKDFPRQAPRTHFSDSPVPGTGLFVSLDHTFEDVINAMNDGNIHRVFVCSKDSINEGMPKPTHVISQRDMLMHVLRLAQVPGKVD